MNQLLLFKPELNTRIDDKEWLIIAQMINFIRHIDYIAPSCRHHGERMSNVNPKFLKEIKRIKRKIPKHLL